MLPTELKTINYLTKRRTEVCAKDLRIITALQNFKRCFGSTFLTDVVYLTYMILGGF